MIIYFKLQIQSFMKDADIDNLEVRKFNVLNVDVELSNFTVFNQG